MTTSRTTLNTGVRDGGAFYSWASVFAALGDETRLTVLAKLSEGQPLSIARLTAGSNLSRQAMTKHLHVLVHAGVLTSIRSGRESLYQIKRGPLDEARKYLEDISRQWDDALQRLRSFVEETS